MRRAVAADDDLLLRVIQRVERVEELGLGLLAFGEELDVVDEQDVDVAVAPLERLGLVVAQAVDEVVGELLGGDVAHPHAGEEPLGVVPDRVQQGAEITIGLVIVTRAALRERYYSAVMAATEMTAANIPLATPRCSLARIQEW